MIDTGTAILYGIVLLFLAAVFGITFYAGIRINGKNQVDEEGKVVIVKKKYLKFFLLYLSYIIFYFIWCIIFEISFTFLEIQMIRNVFEVLYYGMTASAGALFLITIVVTIANAIADNNFSKNFERGVGER